MDRPRDMSIAEGNLRIFFSELLHQAVENQRASVSPHALHYVTELLVAFQETARLFVQQGVRVPVLADMLHDALEADYHRRVTILRQLGDTSLMVSGYFPEALSRRSVDLRYYRKMGEIAYSHLSSMSNNANVFDELSDRFINLSDILNEVSDKIYQKNYTIMKLLELYTSSGSERVFEDLKRQGVIPLHRKGDPKL